MMTTMQWNREHCDAGEDTVICEVCEERPATENLDTGASVVACCAGCVGGWYDIQDQENAAAPAPREY